MISLQRLKILSWLLSNTLIFVHYQISLFNLLIQIMILTVLIYEFLSTILITISPSEVTDMNKYYWIPAVGEPKLIESEDLVVNVWHFLMEDPHHHLCFQIKESIISKDIVFFIDSDSKIRPNFLNKFASNFYPGTLFGDYIEGNVLIVKIKNVKSVIESGILFCNSDINSLSQDDINLINHLLEIDQ